MNCNIIHDLLPLYRDGVCSDETIQAVEEHLKTCTDCRIVYEEMLREPVVPEPVRVEARQEARVLRGVKRKFSMRRWFSVLAVALVSLAALVAFTAAADVEKPIPYQNGLIDAKLAVDEAIDIHFFGEHYASFQAFYRETENGNAIYFCYTQTLKSSLAPIAEDHGHICIGNALMTDFNTASYQVPYPQEIRAVYYLEAGQQDYLSLPQMSDDEFAGAAQDAVLLWAR